MTLDLKWVMGLETSVDFILVWPRLPNSRVIAEKTHIKVQLYADWEIKAKFGVEFKTPAIEKLWKLFDFGHSFVIPAGPVPVVIRPYVSLKAGFGVKPVKVCDCSSCGESY